MYTILGAVAVYTAGDLIASKVNQWNNTAAVWIYGICGFIAIQMVL